MSSAWSRNNHRGSSKAKRSLLDGDSGQVARSRRTILGGLFALVALVGCAGCAYQPPPAAPVAPQTPQPQPATLAAPPPGVELIAEAYQNYLMVTVINHTDKEILVGPKMFAVIAGKKLFPVDPKAVDIQFPIRKLGREEGASGAFQFRALRSLEGQKLVFNSPGAVKEFVVISRYQLRAPNYEPAERPLSWSESRRLRREQDNLRQALMEQLRKRQGQAPKP